MSYKILKKIKLTHPVVLCPGDSLTVDYTGEMGGKRVKKRRLISHQMDENTKHQEYDHVAIYEFENEFESEWFLMLLGV